MMPLTLLGRYFEEVELSQVVLLFSTFHRISIFFSTVVVLVYAATSNMEEFLFPPQLHQHLLVGLFF